MLGINDTQLYQFFNAVYNMILSLYETVFMKYIILVLVWSLFSIIANAQNNSININYPPTGGTIVIDDDYKKMNHFLLSVKNDSDPYFVKLEHPWNSKLYQEQFEQWYTISSKKELVAAIMIDSRFVIQTMPTGYYVKDLRWISPSKRYD